MFNFYKMQISGQTKIGKMRAKKQIHTIYLSVTGFLKFDVVCRELFKFDSDEFFAVHKLTFLNQYYLSQDDLNYFDNSLNHFLFENEAYDFIFCSPQQICYYDPSFSYNFYLFSFEATTKLNVYDQEELREEEILYGIQEMVNLRQYLGHEFCLEEGFYEMKGMEIFSQYSMPKKISTQVGRIQDCTKAMLSEIVKEIEIQDRGMRICLLLDL